MLDYKYLVFQNSHGKAECGCEWIHGTVVEMCDEHVEEMNNSMSFELSDEM